MAVGLPLKTTYANGDVYSASDVNDTNGTINLVAQTQNFYAGKNKIINGDFGIWQRGTSFPSIVENSYFTDRFAATFSAGGGTNTFSRQTFTPGTAPVSGYESSFFARLAVTSGSGSTTVGMYQKIEDVRTLAGQNVTISFWAKADSARTLSIFTVQNFGSGGSGSVVTSTTKTLTTSWARYTYTLSLASISGKTIGTSSFLYIAVELGAGQASGTVALDTWGWQVEQGNAATAFQTATGTIQGELAACQRYYWRFGGDQTTQPLNAKGLCINTTTGIVTGEHPVPMRVPPTSIDYSNVWLYDGNSTPAVTSLTFNTNWVGKNQSGLLVIVASGLAQYRPILVISAGTTAGYLGLSAEL